MQMYKPNIYIITSYCRLPAIATIPAIRILKSINLINLCCMTYFTKLYKFDIYLLLSFIYLLIILYDITQFY